MNTNKEEFINNSGGGKDIIVPDEVKNHFNWGAFLVGWIWGIGNKSYLTFLGFISIPLAVIFYFVIQIPDIVARIVLQLIGLGLAIWFGIKGNEWAWQNKKFKSIKNFHEYQRKWVIWGIILVVIGSIAGLIFASVVFTCLDYIFHC
ncbi:MAG: DUF2628 domain-containing protein [Candidatus Gastranaerophilales bacterium]|nr:DUF2628 domain-containing protein [Candidatus Gastranaerophilales bacterium]